MNTVIYKTYRMYIFYILTLQRRSAIFFIKSVHKLIDKITCPKKEKLHSTKRSAIFL